MPEDVELEKPLWRTNIWEGCLTGWKCDFSNKVFSFSVVR